MTIDFNLYVIKIVMFGMEFVTEWVGSWLALKWGYEKYKSTFEIEDPVGRSHHNITHIVHIKGSS